MPIATLFRRGGSNPVDYYESSQPQPPSEETIPNPNPDPHQHPNKPHQVKSHLHPHPHKLTRILLSSCVPLGLILFLLIFFTSTSESASLLPTNPPDTPNTRNALGKSIQTPQSSYIYQIPYSYHHPNTPQRPRVLVRLSSESGLLRPQTTTQSPIRGNAQSYLKDKKDLSEEGEGEISTEDEEDYPYQFYLDFDDNSKDKSELLPLPSENYRAEQYQNPHQNNIWSDFFTTPTTTPTTSTPTPGSNSISNFPAQEDNYTIPSLKDYRFPEFKTSTATTSKPEVTPRKKLDHLSPYEFFSEEDLENVADLEDDHSKYFVKTKPRDVSSSVANLYNSFYYEPPSYSTKTQPLPVKAKFPLAEALSEDDPYTDKLVYLYSNHGAYPPKGQEDSTMTSPMTPTPTVTTTEESKTTPESQLPPQDNLNASALNPKHDSSTAESIISSRSINQVVTPSSLSFPTGSSPTNLNQIGDEDNISSKFTTTTDATSIPGIPGIDYPIFDEIPPTSFDCQSQRYKGFFADIDTKCQAWHYCDFTDGHSTFLCPNGTLFSQVLLTCDWWFNVDCKQAQQLYVLNERLYRYIKPPKPSFPEDYHGPQVDKWLLKQLELGLLPKIKKKGKPLVEKHVPSSTPASTPDNNNNSNNN